MPTHPKYRTNSILIIWQMLRNLVKMLSHTQNDDLPKSFHNKMRYNESVIWMGTNAVICIENSQKNFLSTQFMACKFLQFTKMHHK